MPIGIGGFMTRDEMLKKFESLEYMTIEPGHWEDVGFTERPIWINNIGWGGFGCDAPSCFGKSDGIPENKWKSIIGKLKNKTLSREDLKDSTLLETGYDDYSDSDNEFLCEWFSSLLLLPRPLDKAYYWAHSWDCIEFFYSKEELYEFLDYECCEKWADFDDEMLKIWYERIFVDELDIDCKVE